MSPYRSTTRRDNQIQTSLFSFFLLMNPDRIEKLANRILLNLLYQKGLEEIRKTFPDLDEGEFFLVYQMARMMAETVSL